MGVGAFGDECQRKPEKVADDSAIEEAVVAVTSVEKSTTRWPCRVLLSKSKENFGRVAAEEEDVMWLTRLWQWCSEGSRAIGTTSDEHGWKITAERGQ
ncbi:hypothetical protein BHE74_00041007 [Ensete ventricosum]|nr:hypothetical protein GW17_00019208 [Ensete ventricosum]RWW52567.1 hypothetical protein BHE74_00041007 [Ensete ventricosum]RZR93393.1 hypothetical protein BHM03_00021883 [Ensete ventricosum]